MEHLQLRVVQDMMDSKFEGYKVSMENVHVDNKTLEQSLLWRIPSKRMTTLQHVKVFSNSNALYCDATEESNNLVEYLYRVLDTGHIQLLIYHKETRKWDHSIVANITVGETDDAALPVNLLFTGNKFAVFCDGISRIAVFLILSTSGWVKMMDEEIVEKNGLRLIEARVLNDELNVLVQSIDSDSNSKSYCKIHWLTIGLEDIDYAEEIKIKKNVVFIQNGHFETCTFGNDDTIIFLSSEKPQSESEEKADSFEWTQEGNIIKILFKLKKKISEEDVDMNITKSEILLTVRGATILNGLFFGEIDADEVELCSDTASNTLTLVLKTTETKKWENLVTIKSETTGRNNTISETSKSFGVEEDSEECDDAESSLFFYWYDMKNDCFDRMCNVSGCQVLFTRRNCVSPATVCLRYNVDGILVSFNEAPPLHSATLHAFGYVQASKLNRIWSGSSPNNKYACIVENNNRVFLYSQKVETGRTLSNRKTSTTCENISRQYILRIECTETVRGVHLTDSHLFAVTENQVHVAELPS